MGYGVIAPLLLLRGRSRRRGGIAAFRLLRRDLGAALLRSRLPRRGLVLMLCLALGLIAALRGLLPLGNLSAALPLLRSLLSRGLIPDLRCLLRLIGILLRRGLIPCLRLPLDLIFILRTRLTGRDSIAALPLLRDRVILHRLSLGPLTGRGLSASPLLGNRLPGGNGTAPPPLRLRPLPGLGLPAVSPLLWGRLPGGNGTAPPALGLRPLPGDRLSLGRPRDLLPLPDRLRPPDLLLLAALGLLRPELPVLPGG